MDTLLLYLRQIHGYCFYCGMKCDDERALAAKCGSQHLRTELTNALKREEFEASPLHASARRQE